MNNYKLLCTSEDLSKSYPTLGSYGLHQKTQKYVQNQHKTESKTWKHKLKLKERN